MHELQRSFTIAGCNKRFRRIILLSLQANAAHAFCAAIRNVASLLACMNSVTRFSTYATNPENADVPGRAVAARTPIELARSWLLSSPTRRSMAFATAVYIDKFDRPIRASAQAVLAKSRAVITFTSCSATPARATDKGASDQPTVANAHTVVARACMLNSPTQLSTALANAMKKQESENARTLR